MPPHPLTKFEIQKYDQNEPNFNGAYSRNNLSKIKDGAYIINRNEFKSIATHRIASYVNDRWPILILFELNILQKKFKNSDETKI